MEIEFCECSKSGETDSLEKSLSEIPSLNTESSLATQRITFFSENVVSDSLDI